ncbi:MAG: Integrase [Dactylosporangium sp.]|jgi:hypothetical protein|nr:Integrase [Dactylosporangium sp.]
MNEMTGTVAFSVCKIEAGLTGEAVDPPSPLVAAEVCARWIPVPAEVIAVAVRWYLRYSLSYRDIEELLVERGIEVDHVTVYRWVQRFTPLLADDARFCRHSPGDRWFVGETYIKVNGVWRYVYSVGFQNPADTGELGVYAARSYSVMSPPRTGPSARPG